MNLEIEEGIIGNITNNSEITMTEELRKHCLELYNQVKVYDKFEMSAVLQAIMEKNPVLLGEVIIEYINDSENFKEKFKILGGNLK